MAQTHLRKNSSFQGRKHVEEMYKRNMFGDMQGDALGRTHGKDSLEMQGEIRC